MSNRSASPVFVVTNRAQARKFAMHVAGKLLREQMITLPVEESVHPACVPMVMAELTRIADGLTKRARNIEADEPEEV